MSENKNFLAEIVMLGRDELRLEGQVDSQGNILSAQLRGIGSPELLNLLVEWRPKLKGPLKGLPTPVGKDPASILLRELLLKAQGRWVYPYEDSILCHCRQISTEAVDQSIIFGAHDAKEVRCQTSASTACGTCLEDVEKVLSYRLDDE